MDGWMDGTGSTLTAEARTQCHIVYGRDIDNIILLALNQATTNSIGLNCSPKILSPLSSDIIMTNVTN